MRLFATLSVALAAAIALPATADAQSPVLVEGVDEATGEAILDLLPDRDPPATLFDAERLSEEAAARALAWLRSEGFYAAAVSPQASEHPVRARLAITPGPLFRFAPPALAFDGAAPDEDAQSALRAAVEGALQPGAPARAAAVLAAQDQALAALQHAGYADAAAGERRVVVDHATNLVAAEFRFSPGAPARLGVVRAEPAGVFRPGFIESLRNWQYGDAYTPQALTRLRRDMSSSGAVSRVGAELAPPGADGVRDVVLTIEPARSNAYELGLGYSTTEGFGLQGEWTRRNFSGRADAFSVALTLAEMQQSAGVELRRPHAAGLGHAIVFGAAVERETLDAYTREGAAVFGSVDAATRLRLARSYGLRVSGDQFDDLAGSITEAFVVSGFVNWRFDTTAFTLDPRDGAISELRIEPSFSTGDATLGFVRATLQARVYESFGREDSLTLAARIRAGWLEAVAGDANDVPPDRRFYAGGGGSVRGYEYNSIYPRERDTLGLTPGGQGVLEGSLEARWRFNERWGAAVFVDGGNAFDSWSDAGDLSFGAGAGLRYDLGFAPLRIDLAVPLDGERAKDDIAVYISLGQAF